MAGHRAAAVPPVIFQHNMACVWVLSVQALAYVVLWQYALSVPFLILYCAVYLALIKDVFG